VSEGLDALNSYKAVFSMRFEGTNDAGEPVSSSFSFEEEFQKQPPAKRTRFSGTGGDAGNAGNFESIEADGNTYVIFGDICSSSDSAEVPTASGSMSPSSVIGNINAAQYVGMESVNGVPAKHYIVDVTGYQALGYVNAQAEAWIADPGNFVVKYMLEATGQDTLLGFGSSGTEGTIHWDYEVTSVNQPVDIQPPENCGGAPDDVPIMDDATGQSSFGGTIVYTSASPLADVVAFYRQQMPANGWSEDIGAGGFNTDQFSMLNFTKGGRSASITISADASNNTTSVLISISGE